MQTLTYNLSRWTTEDLLDEVMRRTASDGPALKLLETIVLRARLAQSDRQFGSFGTQVELEPAMERAGVRGTLEMGLTHGHD
jgi:hypothetical protein